MLTRLAAFVIRFRWWVIGGWAIVFFVSVPFAPRVTSQLKHGFGDIDTESRAARRLGMGGRLGGHSPELRLLSCCFRQGG